MRKFAAVWLAGQIVLFSSLSASVNAQQPGRSAPTPMGLEGSTISANLIRNGGFWDRNGISVAVRIHNTNKFPAYVQIVGNKRASLNTGDALEILDVSGIQKCMNYADDGENARACISQYSKDIASFEEIAPGDSIDANIRFRRMLNNQGSGDREKITFTVRLMVRFGKVDTGSPSDTARSREPTPAQILPLPFREIPVTAN